MSQLMRTLVAGLVVAFVMGIGVGIGIECHFGGAGKNVLKLQREAVQRGYADYAVRASDTEVQVVFVWHENELPPGDLPPPAFVKAPEKDKKETGK